MLASHTYNVYNVQEGGAYKKFFWELEIYKERTSSSCLVAHTSDFLCQLRPMKIVTVDISFKVKDKDNSRNRKEASRGMPHQVCC